MTGKALPSASLIDSNMSYLHYRNSTNTQTPSNGCCYQVFCRVSYLPMPMECIWHTSECRKYPAKEEAVRIAIFSILWYKERMLNQLFGTNYQTNGRLIQLFGTNYQTNGRCNQAFFVTEKMLIGNI